MATKLDDPFGNTIWVRKDNFGGVAISDVNSGIRICKKSIPELIKFLIKLNREENTDETD